MSKNKYSCQVGNFYECKIFEAVNLALYGQCIHVCTVSKVTGINTENNICLPSKKYISGH